MQFVGGDRITGPPSWFCAGAAQEDGLMSKHRRQNFQDQRQGSIANFLLLDLVTMHLEKSTMQSVPE
jgi:hypothetical protein